MGNLNLFPVGADAPLAANVQAYMRKRLKIDTCL